jgi:polyisoprenyl-phosphate glycosyltransferase
MNNFNQEQQRIGQNVTLSVVVPAHNEEVVIAQTISEVYKTLRDSGVDFEVIIVDDGSADETYGKVCELAKYYKSLKAIRLSRNFGKESAILAGLRAAKGCAIITMDADLQHPPEYIPGMISEWRKGTRIVHAIKKDRKQDGILVRLRATIFNLLMYKLSGIDVRSSSDFKLLDRTVVDIITKQLPERQRFFRGLANWVGSKQVNIPFEVPPRKSGLGKWSIFSLSKLAITAIVSFTSLPLRIITFLGIITFMFSLLVGGQALWSRFRNESVSGFVTIIIAITFMGSLIMISLGIMGEYIAKIYDEIKARPPYIVDAAFGFGNEDNNTHDNKNENYLESSKLTRAGEADLYFLGGFRTGK